MIHRHLAAIVMLVSAGLTLPGAADASEAERSFADQLHDVVDFSFAPGWRGDAGYADLPMAVAAWLAAPQEFDRRKDWGDRIDWRREFGSRKDWGDPLKQGIFGHGIGHWGGRNGHGWIDPHCIPAVPEPSGIALATAGLAVVLLGAKRRRAGASRSRP